MTGDHVSEEEFFVNGTRSIRIHLEEILVAVGAVANGHLDAADGLARVQSRFLDALFVVRALELQFARMNGPPEEPSSTPLPH